MSKVTVRIEPLTEAGVASAVRLAVRLLWVKPGDREEQFAADITGEQRQMFVAKANGQVVGYGRILELAAEEAGPGTPAGCYFRYGYAMLPFDTRWADVEVGVIRDHNRLKVFYGAALIGTINITGVPEPRPGGRRPAQ